MRVYTTKNILCCSLHIFFNICKQGCIFFNELWFFPPPFFSDLILFPISLLTNGGIDKHRQNEIKMKENWRKWNFEGNFNALNFDQNHEKIRKNHFGKWKHWFSRITHGNFSLLFPLPFHFFYSSLIFFPSPKTLWFFSPRGGGIIEEYTPLFVKYCALYCSQI
jgi:hypothetical protein